MVTNSDRHATLHPMRFDGGYIYPPRPDGNIQAGGDYFTRLERDPIWLAQAKLNGMNSQLVLLQGEVPRFFTRHKTEFHPVLTDEQVRWTETLRRFAPLVLNFEWLDRQSKTFKKHIYLYDVLVFQGEHLLGTTVSERQGVLDKMLPEQLSTQFLFAQQVAPQVWRAVNFERDWMRLYSLYSAHDIFEGLVLKRANGVLTPGFSERNNHSWAVRARKSEGGK